MNEISWDGLTDHDATSFPDVVIEGYLTVAELAHQHRYFLLTPNPACCLGCIPRHSETCIDVSMLTPMAMTERLVRIEGQLRRAAADEGGWRFVLSGAYLSERQPVDPDQRLAAGDTGSGAGIGAGPNVPGRRRFLAAGAFVGLAACAEQPVKPAAAMSATQILRTYPAVDMHSHAGRLIPMRDEKNPARADDRPLEALAGPMRRGGLSVVCLAVVADTPVTRAVGGHIEAQRDPQPGELYAWANMAFDRAHRLCDSQGIVIVTDQRSIDEAGVDDPHAVIASEGADFLEGQLDRVDEFYQLKTMRQLQLVHYRVNELGDIQTAPAQHGGLTDFGALVIKRCNDLGIVVDVAHATFDVVKRAVAVTSRPLLLSHTALSDNPGPRSRLISREHAKLIAETTGVIGVWPSSSQFADLHAMAQGMARMVEVVGVAHVGLGSDQLGLLVPSVLRTYADLPLLAEALQEVGFGSEEIGQILGGNYRRIFKASVGHLFD
jgi:membrane dipeptidase